MWTTMRLTWVRTRRRRGEPHTAAQVQPCFTDDPGAGLRSRAARVQLVAVDKVATAATAG